MTTTTTAARDAYRALVAERRQVGSARFGNRHLTRRGHLARATSEIADCHVYLGLELERHRRHDTITAAHAAGLEQLLQRAARVGETAAAAAREICDPGVSFTALRRERGEYGERTFGDAFLRRENLPEALEELADAQIFIGLQADWLRHRDDYAPAIQDVLVHLNDEVEQLALEVATTHHALPAASNQPQPGRWVAVLP